MCNVFWSFVVRNTVSNLPASSSKTRKSLKLSIDVLSVRENWILKLSTMAVHQAKTKRNFACTKLNQTLYANIYLFWFWSGISNFDMFHYSRDVVKATEANIKGPVILLASCRIMIMKYCIRKHQFFSVQVWCVAGSPLALTFSTRFGLINCLHFSDKFFASSFPQTEQIKQAEPEIVVVVSFMHLCIQEREENPTEY